MLRFLRIFYFILIIFNFEILRASDFFQQLNKDISISTDEIKPQEFFDILSKELGIDFIYDSKFDFKISVKDYKNKPAKLLLRNLESKPGFQFILKFDKDKPYIAVKLKEEIEKRMKEINSSKKENKIDIELKDAGLIEILEILCDKMGKELKVKNDKHKEKKYTISAKNKDIFELIEEISKELAFSYQITDKEMIIW